MFIAVLAIPLEAASELGLSPAETSTWIMVLYGLSSLIAIFLILRYRQPLVMTGNVFILLFVLLLGGELSFSELVAATVAAGAIVFFLALLGLTDRLASFLPAPIVYGLLAGAVLTLITDMFTLLGDETLLVGSTIAAYFLSRAFLGPRVPAIITALVVGVVVAVTTSATGPVPTPAWLGLTFTSPNPTLQAFLTATPVLVVFITLQANAPSIVFLRSQGYEPPERTVSFISGVATMTGSFFGPMGMSLSLPSTALVAGPDAGTIDRRHIAALVAAGSGVAIALFAGFASELIGFIPEALLDSVVGLAVLAIMGQALQEITKGPLMLGPLVAFVVSVSNIQLLSLGRFFWALVFGLAVSLLLERDAWKTLRQRSSEKR